jgi:HSP20 family protein
MAVFRWGHSWEAFGDLEREVDRILRSVNLTFQGLRLGRQYPPVNLYELEDEYLLTAELPAMHADDLELTIVGGVLSMKGNRSDLDDVPESSFRRRERPQGSWQRSITLPERVREEALSAEFANGVLRIHLPKAEELQPRRIPVTPGTD